MFPNKIRQSPDIDALKLWNGMSGRAAAAAAAENWTTSSSFLSAIARSIQRRAGRASYLTLTKFDSWWLIESWKSFALSRLNAVFKDISCRGWAFVMAASISDSHHSEDMPTGVQSRHTRWFPIWEKREFHSVSIIIMNCLFAQLLCLIEWYREDEDNKKVSGGES